MSVLFPAPFGPSRPGGTRGKRNADITQSRMRAVIDGDILQNDRRTVRTIRTFRTIRTI
jgi:hypothetical protein